MKKANLTFFFLMIFAAVFADNNVRTFTLNLTNDGEAQLIAFIPDARKATGRAVIVCPGGGYSHLSMQNEGTNWAPFFNDQGIAMFVLKYRMPQGDRTIPVSDAENAIKLVRDSADSWNINPADVGIMGSSAGGHLASTVSTHAAFAVRPNFSILFYPVVSMKERDTHKGSVVNFLGEKRTDEALVKEFSNFNKVDATTPPAIILLSSDDRAVPPLTNGVPYYEALVRAGVPASLCCYPSGGHGWGSRETFVYHKAMTENLRAWLQNLPSPVRDASLNMKRIGVIGDSYVANHRRPRTETWHYKLAKKYGMQYLNYGRNGNCIAFDRYRFGESMWKRYTSMADSLDYVMVIAGHNDATVLDSIGIKTFNKRLNALITGLQERYPAAKIMFVSPWRCKDFKGSAREKIVDALAKACKKHKIAFFDAARDNTIKADDDEFRKKYFQSPNDGAHLNATGHDLFLPVAEQFFLKNR